MWSSIDSIVLAASTYYINSKLNKKEKKINHRKDSENSPKFSLPEGDSYSLHCGKIVITTNRLLVFSCKFCNNKYDSVSNFSEHLAAKHLHSENDSKSSSQHKSKRTRTLAANRSDSETLEVNDKQFDKHPLEKDNSVSLDDPKAALSDKTKEKAFSFIDTFQLDDRIEESELLTKSENDFIDDKSDTKVDDEASLSSLEINFDWNLSSDRSYNNTAPHKCNKCDRVFKNKRGLDVHILSHSNVKLYKCRICGVEHKYMMNLKTHIRRHIGVKKFKCELCDKRFFTSTEANRHHRLHTGEKPFLCPQCGRSFSTSGNLTEHMKRHDKLRPKNCEVCGKNFYNNSELKWHMTVHSTDRPFVCTYCPSSFARKKTLQQHMKLHLNAKEYECNFCEKSFNQRPALLSHINNNHKSVNK